MLLYIIYFEMALARWKKRPLLILYFFLDVATVILQIVMLKKYEGTDEYSISLWHGLNFAA